MISGRCYKEIETDCVLNGVSFTVAKGETARLFGRNGAS
jgi:ABC-type multidrug transport system ATPase subunit